MRVIDRLRQLLDRRPAQGPQPLALVRDRELTITWLPGRTDRMLLSFAGMGPARGRRRKALEFASIAGEGGHHVLFITDMRRSWYSRPGLRARIVREVEAIVRRETIHDLRAIGNSMGGYGAILFAADLPISHAAAFVPQIVMTPEVLAMPQWNGVRRAIGDTVERHLGPIMLSAPTRFAVVFGDQDIDDRIHVSHLPQAANINVLTLQGRDHKVARWLKEQGALHDLASAMLDGNTARIDHFRTRLNPPCAA